MNDLTPEQREARLQDARATLLRSLESIDEALEEARRDAVNYVDEGESLRGEPYVEAVCVIWDVRWPDLHNADGTPRHTHSAIGWNSTLTPRDHLKGILAHMVERWARPTTEEDV